MLRAHYFYFGAFMKKLLCFTFLSFTIFSSFFTPYASSLSAPTSEKSSVLKKAYWGAYVIDTETQKVLYSHNSEKLFVPASTAKLITAAVALTDDRMPVTFKTSVTYSGEIDTFGVLSGDLYLVGGGDPTLDTEGIRQLAKEVFDYGIRVIEGAVTYDARRYDYFALMSHSEWEDMSMGYCPEISALSVNKNAVDVILSTRSINDKPEFEIIQPIPYCSFINNAVVYGGLLPLTLNFSRDLCNNEIEITGTVAPNSKIKESIAVHDPAEYARQIFLHELTSLGIVATGQEQHDRYFDCIAERLSPPLPVMIKDMVKNSDNFIAEMLLTAIGKSHDAPGYPLREIGSGMASRFLAAIDDPNNSNDYVANFKLHDGAGLSRHNLISPKLFVKMLQYMYKSEFKDVFVDALPIAGVDGTLKTRFRNKLPGYEITAKTGSMTGINCLAGYAVTRSGKRLTFAIFVNNSCAKASQINQAIDGLVLELLEAYEFDVWNNLGI